MLVLVPPSVPEAAAVSAIYTEKAAALGTPVGASTLAKSEEALLAQSNRGCAAGWAAVRPPGLQL